jgi:acetyltransferase-like isoleucine patch superfamily enzyme
MTPDSLPLRSFIQDPLLKEKAEELLRLYGELRQEMKSRWDRDLPMEELLFDRWERARQLGFGANTSIYHNSYVYGDVKVGENTWVGPFCMLDGSGGLAIGDNCSISSGVHIYSHDTVKWALSGGKIQNEKGLVQIGNCCHVGALAVISKGVTIGDHCVVGAHSFLNQDVPPYTVVVGVPARPIARVEISNEDEVQLVPIEKSEGSSD